MEKTAALASHILQGSAERRSIQRLETARRVCASRCMTTTSLISRTLKQLRRQRIRKAGQQHRLIVGPGKLARVVDTMRALMGGGRPLPVDDADRAAQARPNTKPP